MSAYAADAAAGTRFWAERAWVGGRWRAHVTLAVDARGHWREVSPDTPCPPGARRLPGPVLPGLVDAHSHAFQRAFAGLAERREGAHDDFWSWRDRMYGVALRLTPDQLQAVATQLYVELLRGGYTQVCEFHYLHHAPDGRPYDDPLAMAWALADAAQASGIGLTVLPVLYERAGFQQPALRDDQRRFATTADGVLAMAEALRVAGRPGLRAGVAVHSLRAAAPDAIRRLAEQAGDVPVHVHASEQTAEVDECLTVLGARPIAWLAEQGLLDRRWQLVHATHTVPAEIEAVARAGAGVVLCPGTEANLGDGLADLPGWLAAGVPLSLGSDSQVTRDWREELRWLEGGQRLVLRQRNVAADPAGGQSSSAARLWQRMLDGGATAAGFDRWGLQIGARADLLVADADDGVLLGLPPSAWLDALVFSGPARPFGDVMVGGRWVLQEHRAVAGEDAPAAYARALSALWA